MRFDVTLLTIDSRRRKLVWYEPDTQKIVKLPQKNSKPSEGSDKFEENQPETITIGREITR